MASSAHTPQAVVAMMCLTAVHLTIFAPVCGATPVSKEREKMSQNMFQFRTRASLLTSFPPPALLRAPRATTGIGSSPADAAKGHPAEADGGATVAPSTATSSRGARKWKLPFFCPADAKTAEECQLWNPNPERYGDETEIIWCEWVRDAPTQCVCTITPVFCEPTTTTTSTTSTTTTTTATISTTTSATTTTVNKTTAATTTTSETPPSKADSFAGLQVEERATAIVIAVAIFATVLLAGVKMRKRRKCNRDMYIGTSASSQSDDDELLALDHLNRTESSLPNRAVDTVLITSTSSSESRSENYTISPPSSPDCSESSWSNNPVPSVGFVSKLPPLSAMLHAGMRHSAVPAVLNHVATTSFNGNTARKSVLYPLDGFLYSAAVKKGTTNRWVEASLHATATDPRHALDSQHHGGSTTSLDNLIGTIASKDLTMPLSSPLPSRIRAELALQETSTSTTNDFAFGSANIPSRFASTLHSTPPWPKREAAEPPGEQITADRWDASVLLLGAAKRNAYIRETGMSGQDAADLKRVSRQYKQVIAKKKFMQIRRIKKEAGSPPCVPRTIP